MLSPRWLPTGKLGTGPALVLWWAFMRRDRLDDFILAAQRRVSSFAMSAERYRDYALDCIRVAQETDVPQIRVASLDMAVRWLRLADQADKNSELDLVYQSPPSPSRRVN